MTSKVKKQVTIIGAGIVGLSTAYYLNQRGFQCTVVDAKGPGRETSFGNAGSVSVGNIFPQSMPGIIGKALKMLSNPLAPLKVNWRQPQTVIPWIVQFVAASRRKKVLSIIDALTELNRDAAKCWRSVAADAEANEFVQSLGYLHVYSDRNNFIKGQWERDQMSARGIAFDVLDRDGLLKLEPELGAQFCCGVFQKESLAVLDPGEVCVRLAEFLRRQGVVFEVATVSAIHRVDAGYDVVTDHGTFCSEQVVVAAGAWSTRLLAPFNVTLPIIAARGYHVMFEKATAVVRRPTLWAERYMVLTPMQKGVRMTSIKELTTLDSAPRFQFIRRLLPEAKKLFPALRDQVASEWMGNRPCTPDSLPIIDRVTNENIFVVSGHGHMGLTHGPVSGKLVAQWIAGEKTDINLNPFSYRRFES